MIKIKPNFEPSNDYEVFRLYLGMAAMAMPFYPEDIFPEGFFYPDGNTKKSLRDFIRHARRRTPVYKALLTQYKIADGNSAEEKKKVDALLAEAIIMKFSPKLHIFLYTGAAGNGHIVPEKLRTLLTTPADTASLKGDGLDKVLALSPRRPKQLREDMLAHVFRYDRFSSQGQIHRFVRLLGVDVCPYCNRQYITTVERKGTASPIRPELDHYRSKSQYPFLALSIFNLIPSCPFCNHLKGDEKGELLYPYKDEMASDIVLRTQPVHGVSYLTGKRTSPEDFRLVFHTQPSADLGLTDRANESIKTLRLSELYQAHRDYVSDMMLQRYVFTDEMIESIRSQFPSLFKTKDDVRNMLLLTDSAQNNWGKRPLAKLTSDISEELDELYERKK